MYADDTTLSITLEIVMKEIYNTYIEAKYNTKLEHMIGQTSTRYQ